MPRGLVMLGQTATVLVFMCLTPLYATLALTAILWGVIHGFGLEQKLTWAGWLIAAPILYVNVLNSFLIACAIDIQAWRLLFGFRKHRRITTGNGFRDWFHFQLMLMSYLRERIVWHLPLTKSYLGVDGLRYLVLWAGAPRACLGRDSLLFGLLYDPDLTEIGEGAILGSDSIVSAHAMTVNPDGTRVFVTAPVTIGPRALIGGGARIDFGVRIGADAIIEPMSYVPPYTLIREGEVWGGNPARFIRHRFASNVAAEREEQGRTNNARELDAVPHDRHARLADEHDADVRHLVAVALDLPLDEVHANLSSLDCMAWDSLGQLAIAAGLHDRFGIVVSAHESFCLKSMQDLRRVIASHRSPESSAAASGLTAHGTTTALPNDPELLPLLDHEQATRALSERTLDVSFASTFVREPVTVVVAATFVAEPLANSLKLWSRAFGISVELQFAGFNQVQQCLMTPGSEFHRNATGLNIVLIRPEDLLNGDPQQAVESLVSAMATFAQASPGTLVVGDLPPVVSTFCVADRQTIESLRSHWRERLSKLEGLRVLGFSEIIEAIGISAAGRADLEVVARSPYTPRVYQELGIAIARLVRQQRVAPAKVVALDADGVLWGGVLGEDGLTGIQLGPDHPGRSFQLFQRQTLEWKRRGCLLVIVSRNDEADVWRVFDEHPEMVLRRQDISAARINWRPKSQNLKELAAELNVGLDSFVFLDDDPANRAEVGANAPGVTVIPLPADPTLYCQTVNRLWRFDAPLLTAEDQNRAAMMSAESERKQFQQATTDLASYLQSLQLRVEMRVAGPAELPRVSQLTQKTNQFNSSLKRRSLTEIQSLARTHTIYVVEASDRFGDYGLIGVAILGRSAESSQEFLLDTLLMSCRALGRGIEEAVLHGLGSVVFAEGGQRLVVPCVEGPRNQPCRDFLQRTATRTQRGDEFAFEQLVQLALPAHIEWTGPARRTERRVA